MHSMITDRQEIEVQTDQGLLLNEVIIEEPNEPNESLESIEEL